jgi:hypothetical protein
VEGRKWLFHWDHSSGRACDYYWSPVLLNGGYLDLVQMQTMPHHYAYKQVKVVAIRTLNRAGKRIQSLFSRNTLNTAINYQVYICNQGEETADLK